MSTFRALWLAGRVAADDIDAFVQRWHTEPGDLPIWAFLGLTEEEYALWVERPEILPYVLEHYRTGRDLRAMAEADAASGSPAAEDAARVLTWLRQRGRRSA